MSEKKVKMKSRREALQKIVQRVGFLTIGGVAWGALVEENKATDFVLRPPGALEEKDFIKACIKCGICVDACPYDTLNLAKAGDQLPIGTPYFTPREIPCYMCTDIPCVPVCPTDALKEEMVSTEAEKVEDRSLDINKAQMGLAVLDTETCLAYWGIRCDACYRACPLIDEALTIVMERNERTGKHAMLKPVVHSDICTGCGMCEHACITEKPAIFILPREKAMGAVNNQYIKGWEEGDEARVDTSDVYQDNQLQEQSTFDYLNDAESLFDE